jgi:hypothetical protein
LVELEEIFGDMYEKEGVIFIQKIFNKMKMVPSLP